MLQSHHAISQEFFNNCYGWHYLHPVDSEIVALGSVHGLDVALPVHFHEEDQLTFVVSGRRRFIIGNTLHDIPAGCGFCIPFETPHRSVSDVVDVVCINLYLPPETYDTNKLLMGLHLLWQRGCCISKQDIAAMAAQCRKTEIIQTTTSRLMLVRPDETIERAAQGAGMSREGFSRKFKKLYGMPPQAWQMLMRLNHARRLLRAGLLLADVAAETGFADQSHMGRHFLRFFGTTPGLYQQK